ncbi:Bax inhibitor-1 family protein [Heyndrickxia acidicola]|uniref:Bax inhibitor-1/YccA family protein n=1 Tax=Heyndrickxia acidicola TaxID=209389 RepID=A0ABU6MKV9_9BACI|nr:Bax inhibitor-1/YccA family protein [Heyndrickxia acidicola]MED1205315.1 Bax inhibitor-1/YccA family protein [Heyndrickxia acidicola]
MENVVYSDQRSITQKVLWMFATSLLIATAGLYVGQYVPAGLMLPLEVVEIAMIFTAFWLRRKKAVGYMFVYAFTLISGITMFPVIEHYITTVGANIVLMAFGSTFGIFTVLAIIGTVTKKNLSFLSTILLVSLLALLFIGIFNLFSPLNTGGLMAYSVIGTIVFSLYILFDFNQMKHMRLTEDMVPLLALSLYLDFINLFLNILRFFGIINSRD